MSKTYPFSPFDGEKVRLRGIRSESLRLTVWSGTQHLPGRDELGAVVRADVHGAPPQFPLAGV